MNVSHTVALFCCIVGVYEGAVGRGEAHAAREGAVGQGEGREAQHAHVR
jgi:hypothetical protein